MSSVNSGWNAATRIRPSRASTTRTKAEAPNSGRSGAIETTALAALTDAARANAENIPHEMILLDLYRALWALDSLTGQTTADDILNLIFSTFCIGK